MPAKLSTWKVIIGECKQCKAVWAYEGWDDGKRYKDFKSGREPRLCKRCLDARRFGEYRYECKGCGMQVRGQFEDVRDLVNVLGRSFCRDCMIAFYGRYDPENPALAQVLAGMAIKKKVRRRYYYSDELAREERRYGDRVRRLSHVNLRRYPEILNPMGTRLEPLVFLGPTSSITSSRSQHAGSTKWPKKTRATSVIFSLSRGP
jgi:hypothetical protein